MFRVMSGLGRRHELVVVCVSRCPRGKTPSLFTTPPGSLPSSVKLASIMKAFFHRLHLGGSKDKDRDSSQQKEKFPPLPSWPPQPAQRPTSGATPTSLSAFKPLPQIAPSQIASQLSPRLPPLDMEPSTPPQPSESHPTASYSLPKMPAIPSHSEEKAQSYSTATTTTATSEFAARSSRKTNASTATNANPDVQKKVAFISPPPTPANFEHPLPSEIFNPSTPPQPTAPIKTNISRFQATHGKDSRGSGTTGASSSKTDVTKTTVKATTTKTSSPYAQKLFEGPSAHSLRSGTPYSSISANTSGSRILAAASWSEVTEDDLVSNIGSRERTRQEVLFEIIQSEERYEYSLHSSHFTSNIYC
jgi:hypothetical protein